MLRLSRTLPSAFACALLLGGLLVSGLLSGCDAIETTADAPTANAECELGMSDEDAFAELDALGTEVDALEAAGSLNGGQANALRTKLRNIRRKIERGQYCPALAQLGGFRGQVEDFVADGVLEPTEAEPLIDGADDIANGEDDAPGGPRIAFTSLRDGNAEVYIMAADGSNQTNLTNSPGNDGDASFSPDGSKIVFTSDRDGDNEVYLMNDDGSDVIQLTFDPGNDGLPSFSPDGLKITFASDRDGDYEIYVMDTNGSNVTQLTTNDALEFDPSFSPDGSKIIFWTDRDGVSQIYVMNDDGSNQTNLSDNLDAFEEYPSFSPDGSKIAFGSDRDSGSNGDIYVMDANGSNVVRLTFDPSEELLQSFSPDGSKIAFTSTRDGDGDIYVMDANGSNVVRLTFDPGVDLAPSFGSPRP